jgi:hypothetical protein
MIALDLYNPVFNRATCAAQGFQLFSEAGKFRALER